MATLQQPDLAPVCALTDFPSYAELLSIRPIEAVPDSHHLAIQSRLDSAKDPDGVQTRYSATLSRAALERLHAHLGSYLAASDNPPNVEKADPRLIGWPQFKDYPQTEDGWNRYMDEWNGRRRRAPMMSAIPLSAIDEYRASAAAGRKNDWREMEGG